MGDPISIGLIVSSLIGATSSGIIASKQKAPKAPELPPQIDPEEASKRQSDMRRRRAGTGGRASTIMSGSPLGVPGSAGAGGGRGARLTGGGGY